MSDYVLGPNLRDFEKQFSRLVNVTHRDSLMVFDDMLTYIIGCFNPDNQADPTWRYTKEQNVMFYDLMCEWLQVMQKMIDSRGWYDAFGDFFMSNVGKTSQSYKGQFFTPHHICDFMARITMDDKCEETPSTIPCNGFGRRMVVNDCACGSARLLLAAHAVNIERGVRPCYYVGEDVDRICCKMAAINMCAHGMFGEVVCHNSLTEPEQVNFGYIVNEGLYPFPAIPTIRIFEQPDRFVCCQVWKAKRLQEEQQPAVVVETKPESVPAKPRRKQAMAEQLTINFMDL